MSHLNIRWPNQYLFLAWDFNISYFPLHIFSWPLIEGNFRKNLCSPNTWTMILDWLICLPTGKYFINFKASFLKSTKTLIFIYFSQSATAPLQNVHQPTLKSYRFKKIKQPRHSTFRAIYFPTRVMDRPLTGWGHASMYWSVIVAPEDPRMIMDSDIKFCTKILEPEERYNNLDQRNSLSPCVLASWRSGEQCCSLRQVASTQYEWSSL